MGFMDKVKAQAAGLAEKAQEGAKAGQAKLSDMQAKKHADALLLELGGLVYADQAGRGTPEGETRSAAIIEELRQHVATIVPVAVTTAVGTGSAGAGADSDAAPAPALGTKGVPSGAGGATRAVVTATGPLVASCWRSSSMIAALRVSPSGVPRPAWSA